MLAGEGWLKAVKLFAVGIALVGSIIGGLCLGLLADYLLNIQPVGLLIGLVAGICCGFIEMFLIVKRYLKQ